MKNVQIFLYVLNYEKNENIIFLKNDEFFIKNVKLGLPKPFLQVPSPLRRQQPKPPVLPASNIFLPNWVSGLFFLTYLFIPYKYFKHLPYGIVESIGRGGDDRTR